MDKFTTLTGVAAPMPMQNIDTDKVIPARFLKTIKRTGLGVHLFDALRYNKDGSENPDFVLNQEPYRKAEIIVAYENFGCGSSREHAPWALMEYGFHCVIAPSFADIFFTNSFKNGLLPVVLTESEVDRLFHECNAFPGFRLVVDLEQQTVATTDQSLVLNKHWVAVSTTPVRRAMTLLCRSAAAAICPTTYEVFDLDGWIDRSRE